MPDITNWGSNYENESMKGYILYALNAIKRDQPELLGFLRILASAFKPGHGGVLH